MNRLLVRDVMTTSVITARENEDLAALNDLMFEKHIRHVPVVDKGGDLVGIISHRDIIGSALYASTSLPVTELQQVLRKTKAAEVMVTGVETLEPDATLLEAGQELLDNKFGCLPIVEGTKLVGIITEADFIRAVVDQELEKEE